MALADRKSMQNLQTNSHMDAHLGEFLSFTSRTCHLVSMFYAGRERNSGEKEKCSMFQLHKWQMKCTRTKNAPRSSNCPTQWAFGQHVKFQSKSRGHVTLRDAECWDAKFLEGVSLFLRDWHVYMSLLGFPSRCFHDPFLAKAELIKRIPAFHSIIFRNHINCKSFWEFHGVWLVQGRMPRQVEKKHKTFSRRKMANRFCEFSVSARLHELSRNEAEHENARNPQESPRTRANNALEDHL